MQQYRRNETLNDSDFIASHSKIIETNIDRTKGLLVHVLPKRVAEISGEKPGFIVLYQNDCPIFETASDLIKYFKTLPAETEKNGIWVITANPDSYTSDELENLDQLKSISRTENISLFVSRTPSIPKGW